MLVLACSPRAGGNSDAMAQKFAQGVSAAGGQANLLYLREYRITPCQGCMACMTHPKSACILDPQDDAQSLLAQLQAAPALFIAAPIYFYHLPAHCKALIDRGQAVWAAQKKVSPLRPAYIGLVAAREHGKNLFEGSMLTLKYFLRPLGFTIAGDCHLRGYDALGTLAQDAQICKHLYAFGENAAMRSVAHTIAHGA